VKGKVIRHVFNSMLLLIPPDPEADLYLYPQPGTKKWDTCAPEAILKELGGALTDGQGRQLPYFKVFLCTFRMLQAPMTHLCAL